MKSAVVFSLLFGVSIALPLDTPSKAVFGGSRASQGQFPSHAYVLYTKSTTRMRYGCGGTLISPRHVLTAGHCTANLTSPSTVTLGLIDEDDFGAAGVQRSNVTNFFRQPGYPGSDLKDDIAILEISPEITFTDVVKPIRISRDDTALLQTGHATVTGFGAYKIVNGREQTSRYLLHAEVPLVERALCASEWFDYSKGIVTIEDKQLCAGAANKGVGSGDSGGGLRVSRDGEWFQVGIASFVASNITAVLDQDRVPAVYARVASYCDFIEEVTGNEVQCV